MNNVTLIGRLTADPKLTYTQGGSPYCSFTLAVDRSLSKQKREEAQAQGRPTADFPRVIVWGPQAENCNKYLAKGSKCAVEGRIQTSSYTDSQGQKIYNTDVIGERVEFLDGNRQEREERTR